MEDVEQRLERLEMMISACIQKIDYVDDLFVNQIINPISDAYSHREDEERYGAFKDKYGERLAPYSALLTSIEAEDKDAIRSAYDTYNSYDDDVKATFSEEEYIDTLVTELDKYIAKVRESLGVGKDSDVSITSTNEGDVEVEVDGEVVGTAEKEPIPADEVDAIATENATEGTENTEEVPNAGTETEDKSEEETDEEKAFMEELLRDREKYMKGR